MFYENVEAEKLPGKLVEIGTSVETLQSLLQFVVKLNVSHARVLTLYKESAVVIYFDITTQEEQSIFKDLVSKLITDSDEDHFKGSEKVSASFPSSVEDEGGSFEVSFIVTNE